MDSSKNYLINDFTTKNIIFWEFYLFNDELTLTSAISKFSGNFSNESFDDSVEELFMSDFKNALKKNLQKKNINHFKYEFKFADKIFVLVLVAINPIKNNKNEIIKLTGLIFNITEAQKKCNIAFEQNSLLMSLIDSIKGPVFYKDTDFKIQLCNKAYCDFLGLEKNQIIGHTECELFPKNLAENCLKQNKYLLSFPKDYKIEAQLLHPDGALHDLILHNFSFLDGPDTIGGIIGYIDDVTEEKNITRQSEKREMVKDLFLTTSNNIVDNPEDAKIFGNIMDGLIDIFDDANYGSILELTNNKTLSSVASSGYKIDSISTFNINLKDSYITFISGVNLSKPTIVRNCQNIIKKNNFPEFAMTSDGKTVNSSLFIPIELNPSNQVIIFLDSNKETAFSEFDISISKYVQMQIPILYNLLNLNRQRIELSRYDYLTGLSNRRYFEKLFADRLQLSTRSGAFCVLTIIDLNGLKLINDIHGHRAGDIYIKTFSKRISNYFRTTDIFSRIGGDEFAGIFLTSTPQKLIKKIETFQELFKTIPISSDNAQFFGSFSFGTAIFPDEADTIDELLKVADKRMYQNKKRNKSK